MSVVEDLYEYLVGEGVAAGSTGWTILRRRIMDAPAGDQLIVLTEDGGALPAIPAEEGIGASAESDPAVQVRVRAKAWDGDASAAKAGEIFTLLHGKRNLIMNGNLYLRVRAQTAQPVFMGFDSKSRPEHTISFQFLTSL